MDDPEPGYGGRDTRVDDPCKDGSALSSDFQPDGCADDVIASYKLRRKYRRTERAKSEMEVRTEEEGEEKRRGGRKKRGERPLAVNDDNESARPEVVGRIHAGASARINFSGKNRTELM